jgi:2-polyprenyl-3-methyl-5-hydroxy-6-metoxy-1,4-benzoquinol methylase
MTDHLDQSRQLWDSAAPTFDNEVDHGLIGLARAAWTQVLRAALPLENAAILDAGCGTGSLSVVLAELGHTVTGIDISPEMIKRAEAKAASSGHQINFHVMDAADPQFAPASFDAIVCRHILWALPEPDQVLHRWSKLLKPAGRLALIEGFWSTGAGLHADQVVAALPPSVTNVAVQQLSQQADLWGGVMPDERYIVTAQLPP